MSTDSKELQHTMAEWPEAARTAAKFMTDTYGPPAAVTPDFIAWGRTGPWKRTMISGKNTPMSFPFITPM